MSLYVLINKMWCAVDYEQFKEGEESSNHLTHWYTIFRCSDVAIYVPMYNPGTETRITETAQISGEAADEPRVRPR